jgi:hypothetical protein
MALKNESERNSWVQIADVRRYQQETYTLLLHMRHGPGSDAETVP